MIGRDNRFSSPEAYGDKASGFIRFQYLPGEKIPQAQEPRYSYGPGTEKNFLPPAALFQLPFDEDMDPIAQKVGLLQVMGHMEGSESQRPVQRDEKLLNFSLEGRVQGREGLIQKKEAGRGGQSSAQSHPLFLSPAQPLGITMEKGLDLQGLNQTGQMGVVSLKGFLLGPEAIGEIFFHGKMGEDSQILGKIGNPSFFGWKILDLFSPDDDFAAWKSSQTDD